MEHLIFGTFVNSIIVVVSIGITVGIILSLAFRKLKKQEELNK